MKSIEQQAAGVLAAPWSGTGEGLAKELSDAGLLATERDVLCRAVANALASYLNSGGGTWFDVTEKSEALAAYDREHAPKPRYYVQAMSTGDGDTHVVRDSTRPGGTSRGFGTEAECNAVAAALNALDEERRAKPEHRSEKEAGR